MTSRIVRCWAALLLVASILLADLRAVLAAQGASFVVVRSPSQGNWESLMHRIERLSLPYRIVPLEQLNSERIAEAKLLFLPNLGRISFEQLTAVANWVRGGGKLIVSGPLTVDGPPESRDTLAQLLGGSWQDLRPTAARTEPKTDQEWTRRGNTMSAVQGGVLLRPEGSYGQVAATWQGTIEEPAVLATPESIYMGWQWGMAPPTFDRDWLAAAIERFAPGSLGNRYRLAPVEASAMAKELEGLLARVESALLTSDARSTRPDLFPKEYREAISRANETLKALPALLAAGRDDEARAEWENAIEDLWASYPTSPLVALPEVRAIWLDRGTIVGAGSEEGLTRIFDRLARAGINTVFFETVNAGYPIYPSTVAPAANPLVRGWDPLAVAVRLAHERKMELHAWCWVFAAGNTRHNALLSQGNDFPGPVIAAHPDWAQQDRRGNLRPLGQPETWLDPANPEVRSYLTALYSEIVERYQVDGLQLDYIRYPLQKAAPQYFGYGTAARAGFQQLTGVDPTVLSPQTDPSLWAMWVRYRTEKVTSFVSELSEGLRRIRPELVLSAAVWPQPNAERVRNLQQDWETWVRNGTVDLLVPMTYSLNTRRLQQLVEPVLEGVKDSPVLFLPSLNLMSLPQVQLRDQLQAIRDLPAGGYSLFAMAHLGDNHEQLLGQASSSSKLLPFRDPLHTAVERFSALTKEWDFLLANKQVLLTPGTQGNWQAQAKRTQAALETLAREPSPGWLRTAREEIARTRSALHGWLNLEASLRPYRVSTWDNRLQSLDSLLRYTELRLGRLAKSGR